MNNSGKRLEKLVELAWRGRPEPETAGSQVFSTRVAARWSAGRNEAPDLLEELFRLGRVGLAFAVVVLIASLVFHRPIESARVDILSKFAGVDTTVLSGL